uniref:Uncharacterized protein n=1 Tax=Timema cristinae TaxID=61476 RepID=A0A7R9D186_TIMCR|nr:unnamed protein product [Timema cristinae]
MMDHPIQLAANSDDLSGTFPASIPPSETPLHQFVAVEIKRDVAQCNAAVPRLLDFPKATLMPSLIRTYPLGARPGIGRINSEEIHPHLREWKVENHLGKKNTPCTRPGSNSDLLVFNSLVQHESSTLEHAANEPGGYIAADAASPVTRMASPRDLVTAIMTMFRRCRSFCCECAGSSTSLVSMARASFSASLLAVTSVCVMTESRDAHAVSEDGSEDVSGT